MTIFNSYVSLPEGKQVLVVSEQRNLLNQIRWSLVKYSFYNLVGSLSQVNSFSLMVEAAFFLWKPGVNMAWCPNYGWNMKNDCFLCYIILKSTRSMFPKIEVHYLQISHFIGIFPNEPSILDVNPRLSTGSDSCASTRGHKGHEIQGAVFTRVSANDPKDMSHGREKI